MVVDTPYIRATTLLKTENNPVLVVDTNGIHTGQFSLQLLQMVGRWSVQVLKALAGLELIQLPNYALPQFAVDLQCGPRRISVINVLGRSISERCNHGQILHDYRVNVNSLLPKLIKSISYV